jgi:hypothetical protein
MMHLGGIIGSLPTTTITVTRRSAGSFTNGVYGGGSTTTLTLSAIVAPASPREVQVLPEGLQDAAILSIHTRELLRTAIENGVQADRLTYGGKTYEVKRVEDWSAQAGYYKSLATEVEA